MKVLHVYDPSCPAHAHYVSMLTTAMTAIADVETDTLADPRATADACRQWHPDIVHLHGQADGSVPPPVRVVISPHGMQRAPRHCYAMIARSKMEAGHLSTACQRVETVLNPIITRTTTPQQAAKQTAAIYRKVMDSFVLELMDADTLATLHTLLKAGIAGDARWTDAPQHNLTPAAWRQLAIYARQEGVMSFVEHGAALLGFSIQPLQAGDYHSYVPASYEQPLLLGSATVLTHLEQTTHDIDRGQLPLCRLAELHKLLMTVSTDEERLVAELHARKLSPTAARIMQIAAEQTLLDEGFMPLPPIDDRKTETLRKLIYNHLKI